MGIIFGVFETAMPILGLLAGRGLADTLGHAAHWIGAALLIATGIYALIRAIRSPDSQGNETEAGQAGRRTGRLLITGVALSIDNLAVGFALGTYHVSLAVAAIVIGAVSVTMSLIGLELGNPRCPDPRPRRGPGRPGPHRGRRRHRRRPMSPPGPWSSPPTWTGKRSQGLGSYQEDGNRPGQPQLTIFASRQERP